MKNKAVLILFLLLVIFFFISSVFSADKWILKEPFHKISMSENGDIVPSTELLKLGKYNNQNYKIFLSFDLSENISSSLIDSANLLIYMPLGDNNNDSINIILKKVNYDTNIKVDDYNTPDLGKEEVRYSFLIKNTNCIINITDKIKKIFNTTNSLKILQLSLEIEDNNRMLEINNSSSMIFLEIFTINNIKQSFSRFAGRSVQTLQTDSLILWNRGEISTNGFIPGEIGANGTVYNNVVIEPGKFGNGWRSAGPYSGVWFENQDFDALHYKGTIEFWFKPQYDSFSPNYQFFFSLEGTPLAWNGDGIVMRFDNISSTKAIMFVYYYDGVSYLRWFPIFTPADLPWNAGEWHHMAICWDKDGIDGEPDTMRFYYDNILKASTNASFVSLKWFYQGSEVGANLTAGNGYITTGVNGYSCNWQGRYNNTWYCDNTYDNLKVYNYAKADFSDRFVEGGGITLIFPANAAVINDVTPIFKWKIPIEDNNRNLYFKIEIAEDESFNAIVGEYESKDMSTGFMPMTPAKEGKGTQYFLMLENLNYNTPYFWRVSAWNGQEYYIGSETRSFRITE